MLRMHKAHQNKNTDLSTIAVAALVGGLAGAVVGLMLAPKSGKELRRGICKKSDDALIHVEEVTSHQVGTLKQQGTDLVGKGKQLAVDLQSFIQESLKIKKSDHSPVDSVQDTQTEESSPNAPEMDSQVETEIPLQEES